MFTYMVPTTSAQSYSWSGECRPAQIHLERPIVRCHAHCSLSSCMKVCLCVGKDVLALELNFDAARRQWNMSGERLAR